MRQAFNMANIAQESFLSAAIEETKYLIDNPGAKVREEKKPGIEFPEHSMMKAVIERHPAMLRQTKYSAAFHAKIAPHTFRRYARDAKYLVLLPTTDAQSGIQR